MKEMHGQLDATGLSLGIVVSRFNDLITKRLLEGAMDCWTRHGGDESRVTAAWVPGAFELPMAARRMASKGSFDAVICLGAVIRGSTPHFDFVAAEASKGIAGVALEAPCPVIYGVLTTDTVEQAIERAGTKSGNRGWSAALAAIEMARLNQQIEEIAR
ncbi:MAG: 6,7-dimethyl-8-ribityllumazine synthase [Candidatus Eisenbacteria bacterium]|jgi:6,7-dimethyl-8-ribityllumazine synthase|nr:6,7-dimethyl-8-ribityllumazine synthase [Candidatus Eisenbacteria bacterium]